MDTDQSIVTPKLRRPWLQFSLRTLLIVLTLFGIWLGVRINLARKQRETVQTILATKGDVKYRDLEYPSIQSREPRKLSWLETQLGLDFFYDIDEVGLRGDSATDKTLEQVGKFPRVRQVWISHAQITDDGLTHMRTLRQLEGLGLLGSPVSGHGLTHVSSLPRLKTLDLGGSPITNESLAHIGMIHSLESLHLSGGQITDAGMEHLASLPNLRELQLHETRVTDVGIGKLVNLPNLEVLKLPEAFTDDGCQHLTKMKKLKVLFSAKQQLSPAAQTELINALPGISLF
jgi:Leucine-rich repeat (LRR) protein